MGRTFDLYCEKKHAVQTVAFEESSTFQWGGGVRKRQSHIDDQMYVFHLAAGTDCGAGLLNPQADPK